MDLPPSPSVLHMELVHTRYVAALEAENRALRRALTTAMALLVDKPVTRTWQSVTSRAIATLRRALNGEPT